MHTQSIKIIAINMKTLWTFLIIIPFFVFAQNGSTYEQDIIDEGNILQNFKIPIDYQASIEKASLKLFDFADYIYSPKLLRILNAPGVAPQYIESDSIVNGAWGRGQFTKWVDSYLFSKIDISKTNYLGLWTGTGNTPLHYWSASSDLSYCSKSLLFTIYWCKSHSNQVKYINRIKEGLSFLLNNQQSDGGFIQYWFRKSQTDPAPDMTVDRETSYATGDVLRAIVEGYFFFKDNIKPNDLVLLNKLISAIKRGGNYLMSKQCYNEEGNNNYKCFSIWGLVSVYKITGNKSLLDSAVAKYNCIRDYQNDDGAWFTSDYDSKNKSRIFSFHDTHPDYMGIILRGFGELYSILPNNYPDRFGPALIKKNLKKNICLTINNFLRLNMCNGQQEPRVSPEGMIKAYKKETEYVNSLSFPLNLIHGLKYIENCNDSLKLNPRLLSQLLKLLMVPHIIQINSSKFPDEVNHDDNMISFGLELVPNQLSKIYNMQINPG